MTPDIGGDIGFDLDALLFIKAECVSLMPERVP
jgi:hypothetical protein